MHHRLATSQCPGLHVEFISSFSLLASSKKSPETTEIFKMAEESSSSEESPRQLVYLRWNANAEETKHEGKKNVLTRYVL